VNIEQRSAASDNDERGKSGPATHGNPGSLPRDPQGHRRDVVGFLRLGGRRVAGGKRRAERAANEATQQITASLKDA